MGRISTMRKEDKVRVESITPNLDLQPNDVVTCTKHHVIKLWKDLDDFQKIAVDEGVDFPADKLCMLSSMNKREDRE